MLQSSRTFIRLSWPIPEEKKIALWKYYCILDIQWFLRNSSDYLGLSQKKKKLHYENIIVYWEESSKVK